MLGDGMTVQDYYNADRGPDHWYFDAESGQDYTFTLRANSDDHLNLFPFDPWIELYHVNHETGEETQLDITDPLKMFSALNCAVNDNCAFTFDPAEFGYSGTGSFYVKLGSNNGDGFYRLSMNDAALGSVEEKFWVDGLYFNAGGDVTMTGYNNFSGNSLAGMMGKSEGTIRLANVGAFNNSTEGISLINQGLVSV